MIKPTNPAIRFIQTAASVIGALLSLRFLAKLLGYGEDYVVPRLLYRLTEPLVAPFNGWFPDGLMGLNFEWKTLLAVAVYGILATLLVRMALNMNGERNSSSLIESDANEE